MRILFIILVGIHGLIHFFGFLKAFGIIEFSTIDQPISKSMGIVWLLSSVLFALTTIGISFRTEYWWSFGFTAITLSQSLIFIYWSDAKFGTLINLLILAITVLAYANYNFNKTVKSTQTKLLSQSQHIGQKVIDSDDILHLPPAVQKWLNYSGIIGNKEISNVYLTQSLALKLKPEQSEWYEGTAEQYFWVDSPAFIWTSNIKMNALLNVVGRDQFQNGQGEMQIRLLALIPIAEVKNNEKINQATLQRYLAEMVWFPSAALNPNIKWEHIDAHSARATMTYNGTQGSGVFYFDEQGEFKKFTAQRYKDAQDPSPTEWTVSSNRTEVRQGIKIPTECEASWQLNGKQWTWLTLKIDQIKYNVKTIQSPIKKENSPTN